MPTPGTNVTTATAHGVLGVAPPELTVSLADLLTETWISSTDLIRLLRASSPAFNQRIKNAQGDDPGSGRRPDLYRLTTGAVAAAMFKMPPGITTGQQRASLIKLIRRPASKGGDGGPMLVAAMILKQMAATLPGMFDAGFNPATLAYFKKRSAAVWIEQDGERLPADMLPATVIDLGATVTRWAIKIIETLPKETQQKFEQAAAKTATLVREMYLGEVERRRGAAS